MPSEHRGSTKQATFHHERGSGNIPGGYGKNICWGVRAQGRRLPGAVWIALFYSAAPECSLSSVTGAVSQVSGACVWCICAVMQRRNGFPPLAWTPKLTECTTQILNSYNTAKLYPKAKEELLETLQSIANTGGTFLFQAAPTSTWVGVFAMCSAALLPILLLLCCPFRGSAKRLFFSSQHM